MLALRRPARTESSVAVGNVWVAAWWPAARQSSPSEGGAALRLLVIRGRSIDGEGTDVFRRFWMGRRILDAYEQSRRRGEMRVCFLRITLDPIIRTYAVGYSVWVLRQRMESA